MAKLASFFGLEGGTSSLGTEGDACSSLLSAPPDPLSPGQGQVRSRGWASLELSPPQRSLGCKEPPRASQVAGQRGLRAVPGLPCPGRGPRGLQLIRGGS